MLERANGAFNSSAFGIQRSPLVGATQYAWIKTQIGIGIDVNASPISRSRTRLVTAAAPSRTIGRFHTFGFRTYKFEAHGAVFPAAYAVKFQLAPIVGAKRNTVLIQMSHELAGGIAAAHRNNSSLRACLISRRMPVDEGFFRQARRDLAGIIVFISRDHNEAWREKTRQTAS